MTARQIMTQTLAEATGKSEPYVRAVLDCLPVQPPGLDQEYTAEQSEKMLADLRQKAAEIRNGLIAGGECVCLAGPAIRVDGEEPGAN